MSNDLVAIEAQYRPVLEPYQERYEALLKPVGMDKDRLINSCHLAIMKTPKLQQCPAHTVANAVMTGAVLGLEMDGHTGQGFIIPRSEKGNLIAQFQLGYKGGITTAQRAGFSINMNVVREGDAFEYELGTSPLIMHKPRLGEEHRRKIIAAYAVASSPNRAPYIEILSIDQLLETKRRAAAASSGFSPWNDEKIGFPAMCAKTASLRLRLPHVPVMQFNQYGLASAVDITTEDRGMACHLTDDGALMTAEGPLDVQPEPPRNPATRPPKLRIFKSRGDPYVCTGHEEYRELMGQALVSISTAERLKQFKSINIETIEKLYREAAGDDAADDLLDQFDIRLNYLEGGA